MAINGDWLIEEPVSITSTKTDSNSFNYGTLGLSLVPLLTGILGTQAKVQDIKSRNRAAIAAIQREAEQTQQQLAIIGHQDLELDQQLFGAMSERGLEALKAEGRLRAGAAETGTSGGTTDVAVGQAYMDLAMDSAVLAAQASSAKLNLLRRADMAMMSSSNKMNEYIGNIQSSTGAGLATASTFISSFGSGYSMLGKDAREQLFNFNE